jgi:hypothetical protein
VTPPPAAAKVGCMAVLQVCCLNKIDSKMTFLWWADKLKLGYTSHWPYLCDFVAAQRAEAQLC